MHEPTPDTIRDAHARLRPSPQAENPSARCLSGMELTLGSPLASQYLDVFNREMKPRSANWAIWWSDLMMTMFIMFAALYAFQMPVTNHHKAKNQYNSDSCIEIQHALPQ